MPTTNGKFYADTFLEYMLELIENLQLSPDSYLYSRLFGVFLSTFVYAPIAGIQFLVRQGRFEEIVKKISYRINSFVTVYDKKLLILGMISIFREKVRQQQLDTIAIDCLDLAIKGLHIQRIEEEIKFVGNNKSHRKTRDDGFKTQLSQIEKEDQSAYNLIKGRNYELTHILEEQIPGEENEDILTFMLSDTREAEKTICDISSPVNQIDEFAVFKQLIIELKVRTTHAGAGRQQPRQSGGGEALERVSTGPARPDDRGQGLDGGEDWNRRTAERASPAATKDREGQTATASSTAAVKQTDKLITE